MAMNKKEKETLEVALNEVRLAKSLKWTDKVERDLKAPEPGEPGFRMIKGWDFNTYSGVVDKSCSTAVSHAWGRDDATTTQKSRSLYSTKLLALKALRNSLEYEFAQKLARVDKQIEEEMTKEVDNG